MRSISSAGDDLYCYATEFARLLKERLKKMTVMKFIRLIELEPCRGNLKQMHMDGCECEQEQIPQSDEEPEQGHDTARWLFHKSVSCCHRKKQLGN
jgi:hypothetical protein